MAGARRYEDLIAWQLSAQLCDGVDRIVTKMRLAGNVKFREQILDASSSPPRNIAEGFGRFRPKPLANFLRIARASLMETRNLLQEGRRKRYFTAADVEPLLRLQARASKATLGLTRYLERLPPDFDITPDDRT